ncbi:hypothetical protein STCU_11147 [Strigomonas culicis]|uniref:Dephospho-CoA kinase n=1 Tax=Strigomonas culicis TaxID=28005 RepID=S9UPH5_9TRYP|nr:hypothetical protein STCU_11147 [Strigomonas culicis]|eukprot:EPY16551.1 hypothetical protein STCU_11147 [Strigomonas culicis]
MLRVIGFTGTIASGKTARCRHLLRTAHNYQLRAMDGRSATHPLPAAAAAPLSVEEALRCATVRAALPALRVGVKYINADLVGHAIYLPGKPCYYDLIRTFGERIVATEAPLPTAPAARGAEPLIDRRVLGGLVFADRDKLQALNRVCGPYIARAMAEERAALVAASRAAGQRGLLLIVEAALLLQMAETMAACTDVWYTHCREPVAVARVAARDGLPEAAARQRVASQRDVLGQLRGLREAPGPLRGNVVALDTSDVTLEEGLAEVERTFERFWRDRVAPLVAA